MKVALTRTCVRLLIVPVVAALAILLAGVPGAQAATDLSVVADKLRESPVYVDPEAKDILAPSDAEALADKIEDSDKPIFIAVLPEDYPTQDLFRNLRTETGVTGLYGIRLGDRFDARADSSVLGNQGVRNLVASVQDTGDAKAQLNDFVDNGLRNIGGGAPNSWNDGSGDVPVGGLITVGALVAAGGAGVYAVSRRNRRRHEEEQRVALEKLRVVVDEDITAFGEELDRLDFHPGEAGADDAMRTDYKRALDAYEQAKSYMAAARRPEDVRAVTQAVEDGRFALARLDARRNGGPLPERRTPCFFDPRHGPSVTDVSWAPPGGAEREVPVCEADRDRLDRGAEPAVREVDTDDGRRRPYWEAGPAYGPWAGGYFGGGLLPGLLIGTMLGGMMAGPGYASDYGAGYGFGGYEGGDVSGADFNSGDFGGGFGGGDFGGGGFGGGDFGGGF